jgi:hypothetical protein
VSGAVGIALAGLAAKTWAEMWRLYQERYGKWGEETVRRLQREIEDVKADNVSLGKMLDIMRDQLHRSRSQADHYLVQWLASDSRANELASRLNEAMCKIARLEKPLDGNPYPAPGTAPVPAAPEPAPEPAPDTEETPS